MLVTVSASTVPTVSYLSIYDLKNYKKQFQGFWIPFMEQFVPATTIWVAGERWCNEPCTIINACDYDYEFVEGSLSFEQIPTGLLSLSGITQRGFVTNTIPVETSVAGSLGTPVGTIPVTSPEIVPITDLGMTSTTPVIRTQAEVNIDILAYRNRFTEITTQTTVL